MLAFAALLLFAILGIAALNVDMGLAFGSKARLESAAETLALERSRLGATLGAGTGEPVDEESELRGLLQSLIASSPRDPSSSPGGGGGTSPLPIEGPVLSNDGGVALSRRIPLLFGMAAVPSRDAEGLSLRQLREARESGTGLLESGGLRGRGLAPGARARAQLRPVLRVGFPQPVPFGGSVPGLADVALELAALRDPLTGAPSLPTRLDVDAASGDLRRNGPTGPVVGQVIAHPANDPSCLADRVVCRGWRVGDTLGFTPGLPAVSGRAYVPVYVSVLDALPCNRVVGYVSATLSMAGTTLQLGPPVPGQVPENVSAVPHAFDPAGEEGACTLRIADVLDLGGSLPLLQVAGLDRGEPLATEAP